MTVSWRAASGFHRLVLDFAKPGVRCQRDHFPGGLRDLMRVSRYLRGILLLFSEHFRTT
nr:hypothetical protein [Burkholderia ambifaria]